MRAGLRSRGSQLGVKVAGRGELGNRLRVCFNFERSTSCASKLTFWQCELRF